MAPSSPPARPSWLAIFGAALLLLLAVVAILQVRQFSLLGQATQPGGGQAVLAFHEAEAEHLRLSEQWLRSQVALSAAAAAREAALRQAVADGTQAPAAADEAEREARDAGEALRLRYQVFASRIERLERLRGDGARPLLDGPEHQGALQALQAFVGQADAVLGRRAATPPDAAALAALEDPLAALGPPLHALAQAAARTVAERETARHDTLRLYSQLDLALTATLAVLVAGFAVVALRHVRDLRQRRLALEDAATQLRVARREAEAASEAKSVFLANMSHEIRTPFHGLMGMLSLLRETGLTPRQVDYLRTATESADHLLAILNGILDMSQLESGRMTLSPAPVELRTLLRDVEALMRPQATAKALALHLDADPQVPERVLLDATRVKQILFNLLSNAIKFSDRGAVVLDVRAGTGADGQPELRFVVTDTGMGMDGAALAQLFTRFTPGEGTRSRRQGGTGLGLEISRSLARLMHGDISVRSRPGEGSCFTLHLPLTAVPARGASPAAAAVAESAARPLQVLVAEDHPVNRQYMAALLENLGHAAHFTANGQEAVSAARERPFDIILMDLHMPVMDGMTATRAIRSLPDPQRSTVPIVALTADAFDETRQRCLVAGMNDFLTKPVSPQKLATALRRLFGSGHGDASPAAAGPHPAAPAAAQPANPPPAPPPGGVIDLVAIEMALQAMPRPRLAAMIEAFLDQGPQTVERLRAAMRDAQPLELRVNAHAARGAALNLGLSGLAATAEALHEGAAHLPAHEIARLVQRYEELLPLTRAAVRTAGLAPEAVAAD